MADLEKPKVEAPLESPTTARELDFEDEPLDTPSPPKPVNSSGRTESSTTATKPITSDYDAPQQPPRPLSPQQQAENTLKEAFPSIDAAVVKAVLMASGGRVEPAFNALLGMSDPDSQREPTPPPQPPRPITASTRPAATRQSQLEADELYARRLAQQYNDPSTYGGAPRSQPRAYRDPPLPKPNKQAGLKPNELYDDREHSFLDDDFPVIRENIKKGFFETQTKVNSFINNIRRKIDGDDEEEENLQRPPQRTASSYSTGQTQQQISSRRSGDYGRRSGDRERYDADPQVLSDDFGGLELRDESQQRRSNRPLANPDLFKPTPIPPPSSGRRVSFQNGPPEEIDDLYRSSPDPTKRPSSSASRSKWQPLAAVDPDPVADHDPFSLGDSDDEDTKKKDLRSEDTERLKNAAAEATADNIGTPNKSTLHPSQTVGSAGTRDRDAEEKLTGNS